MFVYGDVFDFVCVVDFCDCVGYLVCGFDFVCVELCCFVVGLGEM